MSDIKMITFGCSYWYATSKWCKDDVAIESNVSDLTITIL